MDFYAEYQAAAGIFIPITANIGHSAVLETPLVHTSN